MDNVKKKHHHLIAGSIMFQNKISKDTGQVTLNGILLSDSENLPLDSLGRAQKVLQFNFLRNAGEEAPNIQIVDVPLYNFTYLGYFTEAEFKAVPEGATLKEMQTALQEATDSAVPLNQTAVNDAEVPAAIEPEPAPANAEPEAPTLSVVKNNAEPEGGTNEA